MRVKFNYTNSQVSIFLYYVLENLKKASFRKFYSITITSIVAWCLEFMQFFLSLLVQGFEQRLVACPFITAITTVANSIIDASTRDPRRRTFTEKSKKPSTLLVMISRKIRPFHFPSLKLEQKERSWVLYFLSKRG